MSWAHLGYSLIHSKRDYQKCLITLQKLELAQKAAGLALWHKYGYCIQAWRGICWISLVAR